MPFNQSKIPGHSVGIYSPSYSPQSGMPNLSGQKSPYYLPTPPVNIDYSAVKPAYNPKTAQIKEEARESDSD
jgi:hypothetical protein